MLTKKIRELTERYSAEMYEWRHHLHQNPELSFEEKKTAEFVAARLNEMGLPYETGIATTGICAVLKGGKPGKTLLIRADMDAIPVQEKAGEPFASQNPGVMHACGHDGHVAQALCAAKILNELRDELCGTIKLVFQPGEENGGGGRIMIEEGVLKNPDVDAAVACHLWGPVKAGNVALKAGPLMAATDTFYLTLRGKGGHGAMPHLAVDPVVMAADFIMQVQTVAGRRIDPQEPVVITCGSIHGGQQHNVIPSEVKIAASVRMFSEETAALIQQEVERIAQGIALGYGGSYELDYRKGFPPVINDATLTQLAQVACGEITGVENTERMRSAEMCSEDFAFFGRAVPSVFFFVGIAEPDKPCPVHHHESFCFADRHMKTAAACLANFAVEYLNGKQK